MATTNEYHQEFNSFEGARWSVDNQVCVTPIAPNVPVVPNFFSIAAIVGKDGRWEYNDKNIWHSFRGAMLYPGMCRSLITSYFIHNRFFKYIIHFFKYGIYVF